MINTNCNVGTYEKNIRAFLGVLIFSLGIYFTNWLGMFAIYFFLTAIFKWCPINYAFHIDHYNEKQTGNPLEGPDKS